MTFDDSHNLADRSPDEAASFEAPVPRDETAEREVAATPEESVQPMADEAAKHAADAEYAADATSPAPVAEEPAAEEPAAEEPAAEEPAAEETVAEETPAPYVERPPVELAEPEPEVPLDWYILKVQSNREESIRDGLMRRVKVAGLEDYFKEIIVPTETVTEFKNGKKRTVKRKLYPGYIVVNMAITDDTWFLVRETPGIGDFTGAAGKPSPMLRSEVEKIEQKEKAVETEQPTLSIAFKPGDNVKINEGTFENFEGEVSSVDATNGRITVMINIFGRSTPVELEYWQVEGV